MNTGGVSWRGRQWWVRLELKVCELEDIQVSEQGKEP